MSEAPPSRSEPGGEPPDRGAERREAALAWSAAEASYRLARKVVVAVVGTTLVVVGLVLLVLPGPASLVIPLGLAVLSVEFAWARRWLHRLRAAAGDALDRLRGGPRRDTGAGPKDA